MSENYKDVYSDVTITVKGKDFQGNKSVLAARSPVFAAMFGHDMVEKNSNSVSITDCDPGSFDAFLHFLYTSELKEILPSKVFSLYETANKYDVKLLKEGCLNLMKRNFSTDTFCDAVILATAYGENELLQRAIEYFIENCRTIIHSVEWQIFIKEHPAISNELFIKYVDREETINEFVSYKVF